NRLGEFIKDIPLEHADSVLEIGCGTGFLTEYFIQNFSFNRYVANDIIPECADYVDMISPEVEFLEGDVEELALDEKFDLIVSNATLQWAEDLKSVVSKLNNMLKDRGILAFSIFGNRNLEQMSKILQRGLKYYSVDQLRELFSDYKILLVQDEIIKLNF